MDTRSHGAVALKIARGAEHAALLAREATQAALALSPRLPELLDVGRLPDGRAFIALRWMEGAALDPRRVSGDRKALALRVAAGIGEALADLHGVGLAHGDVKPDNILLDAHGDVRLLDLGLAGPAHAGAVTGATLRYLARGDADLGDARARDLLALGVVIAEIADEGVAQAADAIAAARAAMLPAPLGAICSALLAPSPGARPSAAWVSEMAGGAARALDRADRDARAVRAAYLRVRRADIEGGGAVHAAAAPWLAEAMAWAKRARALASVGDDATGSEIGPMDADQIARWLTALAGSAAAAWPLHAIAAVPERALAEALTALARRLPKEAWTLRDVEAAVQGSDADATRVKGARAPSAIDAENAARIAIELARVPADPEAVATVERCEDAPAALVMAAAEALRLAGQLGRARGLMLRANVQREPGAAALAADVRRRAGDGAAAEALARKAIEAGADPEGRARAVLARIALDRGDLARAEALSAEGARDASGHVTVSRSPALCEVAALAAAARGNITAALAETARGEALAATAEERARTAGLRGYVILGVDPEAARAAFATAADHAARAGAVVEEATYRTGEAAAAVDVGDLGSATATARRAALLWEHLGRPAMAARALLAAAAAMATAGAAHETERAAREARARAAEAGDLRAEAYAWWAVADVAPAGQAEGVAAAERAAGILETMGDATGREDELRAAARLLRHGSTMLSAARGAEMDRLASDPNATKAAARLDWFGARAARATSAEGPILAALTALADAPASIGAKGPALAAGVELAARTGHGEIAQRLLAALGDAARELVRRASPALAGSVRALPWVTRAAAAPESVLRPEQARDLESLIRGLGDRERLAPLLSRIVDALVLWTGVERGLLLLRAPDGRLVPRAARNLARADLGDEQMGLSQTLAKRALEAREPVVAVDAEGEMGNVHQSIHALKLRSVLAVPLIARGEPLGVVYLDDRIRRGAFGPREIDWARTIASLAALVIADARDQVLLRRAARRARRASEKLAETLSLREAALDAAERELARARGEHETRFAYDSIVGISAPVRAMLKLVDRVTTSEVPVLVMGESGSGKELVARAIHDNGPRRGRPFVGENCGAIPEGLLESALFGHVRGAFTGAAVSRAGLFEVADRGTLFLDEIGEMSLGMQTKLLRVLEDGLVRPVGSERARKVDVRVIAATHRDLAEMVKEKRFREDLFYRLDIITVRIPPLREREGDVPLLVARFLDAYGGGRKVRVTPAAMARLSTYAWPGNVRQLQNEVRRALVLSDGVIDVPQLSPEIAGDGTGAPPETGLHVRRRIDQLERSLVREALEKTGGNQTQAAKLLGLSRFGLQKMIKRLEISYA
ncbi:Response regulator of zinc sigma-54-dependent two-component system [Minicystis rosea]|nr:Response regulator of zinc sigma-54-dependent two-component system [Minicystis rosea]